MEENLHKDPLEELFRKNLEDPGNTPADDGWDLPSDKVWEGISEVILPPPSASGFSLHKGWLLLLGLGIAALVYWGYSYQRRLNDLAQQVEKNSSQLDKISTAELDMKGSQTTVNSNAHHEVEAFGQPSLNQQTATHLETSKQQQLEIFTASTTPTTPNLTEQRLLNENTPATKPSVKQKNPELSALTTQAEKTTSAGLIADEIPDQTLSGQTTTFPSFTDQEDLGNTLEIKDSKEQKNNLLKDVDISPQESEKTNRIEVVQNSEDEQNEVPDLSPAEEQPTTKEPAQDRNPMLLEELPLLPRREMALPAVRPRAFAENESFKPVVSPAKKTNSKAIYVGLFYAPTAGYRSLQAKVPAERVRKLDLNQQEHFSYASTIGGKVGLRLGDHWAIETGGQLGETKIKSVRNAQLRYSRQSERPVGDRFEGNYRYVIPTSYGDVEADIALSREAGTSIADQEILAVRLVSEQKLQFITIPLIGKYIFGKGPFEFNVRGGVAANILRKNEVAVTSAALSRRGMMHRETKIVANASNLRTTTFDYLVGVGLEYLITPRLSVSVEPTFSKAMTAIYAKDNLRTFPIKTNLALGLNYMF